jgi:acetolactate synthase-1/2/3 large subunit
MIDPMASVYPMVGPGQAYEQMITGDWIAPRGAAAPDKVDPQTTQMF